jgi:hypothetical protein
MSAEFTLKVVVFVDSFVGKTCVSLRFLKNEFTNQTRPTIAGGFCDAKVKLGAVEIGLLIWDTAGQEAHRSLTSQSYREAKITFIPVFSGSTLRWHFHANLCLISIPVEVLSLSPIHKCENAKPLIISCKSHFLFFYFLNWI